MASSGIPLGPFPPGTDPEEYDRLRRRVLWAMPSGLYLLGSRAGGERNLMTLNWATQVSSDPKLVAVSVETTALTHRLVDDGGVFALSLLQREDRAVVRKFVKPVPPPGDPDAELNGFAVRSATTGAPILAQALAWLDCEVTDRHPCGSHTLFVGRVVDAGADPAFADGATGSPEVLRTPEVLRMEDTRMNYGG